MNNIFLKKIKIESLLKSKTILQIQDGNHGELHPTSKDYIESGDKIPFIMANDIVNNTIDFENCKHIARSQADKLRIGFSKTGDILLTHKGTIGSVAIVPEMNFSYIMLTPQVTYYRVNNELLDSKFLSLYFRSPLFQSTLKMWSAQATRPYIGITAQKQLELNVPAISAQKEISSILSTYDTLIELNEKRIKILEEMAQRLYAEWFINFRFPGYEKVKMVDSATEFGMIPDKWEIKKLGDVVTLVYGKALVADDRCAGDIPVYGSSGIVGTHNEKLASGPGVIVGRKGNVGSVYWSDKDFYAIDTTYYVQSPLDLHFVYYLLKAQNFISSDVAVPGLSRNQAYSIEIISPSSDIINKFSDFMKSYFNKIVSLKNRNANLIRVRDLLISQLVTGKRELRL